MPLSLVNWYNDGPNRAIQATIGNIGRLVDRYGGWSKWNHHIDVVNLIEPLIISVAKAFNESILDADPQRGWAENPSVVSRVCVLKDMRQLTSSSNS
jgi:hypothetical protein